MGLKALISSNGQSINFEIVPICMADLKHIVSMVTL